MHEPIINPLSITHYAVTSYQLTGPVRDLLIKRVPNTIYTQKFFQFLLKLEPFVKPAFLYPSVPIASSPRYQIVSDILSNSRTPTSSYFYRHHNNLIDSQGFSRFKNTFFRTPSDILSFLKFYESKLTEPIDDQYQLPELLLDQNLNLLKASRVNHRFCAKHFLNDPTPIRFKISGVHYKALFKHPFSDLNKSVSLAIQASLQLL